MIPLLITLLLLLSIRPTDGGNHPRKEAVQTMNHRGFHPPKEWGR